MLKNPSDSQLEMAQNNVIGLFNFIYPVGDPLIVDIKQNSYLITRRKKQRLLEIGQTQRSIYFIIQGAVRSYYIDPDGNEVTSWLLFENDLAISVFSFFSQRPSFECLETLEDCTLLVLDYKQLLIMYRNHLEFNYIGRVLTEKYYIRSEEKANELRMYGARQRYLNLLENCPMVVKRTPLGIIASYLGITKSTLSRIRSKIH